MQHFLIFLFFYFLMTIFWRYRYCRITLRKQFDLTWKAVFIENPDFFRNPFQNRGSGTERLTKHFNKKNSKETRTDLQSIANLQTLIFNLLHHNFTIAQAFLPAKRQNTEENN